MEIIKSVWIKAFIFFYKKTFFFYVRFVFLQSCIIILSVPESICSFLSDILMTQRSMNH